MTLLVPAVVGGKVVSQSITSKQQPDAAQQPIPAPAVSGFLPSALSGGIMAGLEKLRQPSTLIIPDAVGKTAATQLPKEKLGVFARIAAKAKSVGSTAKKAFTGEDKQTQETRDLPELGSSRFFAGEGFLKSHKVATAILLTPNAEEIGKILTSNFPHVKITKDEKGNSFALNTKNGVKVVINRPGLSLLDVKQSLGTVLAFTPAGRVATAGTATAKVGAGLLAKGTAKLAGRRAAQGAVAAGVTEAAIQKGQEAVGGTFDIGEVAASAALGGLAETIVPAFQGLRQGRQAAKIGAQGQSIEDVASNVAEATRASEATGIPLFQAQKTLVPAQLEKQSFLPTLPAATQKASRELKRQNKAASDAVDTILDQIAPAEAVTIGPGRFRTAAQRALEKQKNIRAEKSAPIYREAFKDTAGIDVKSIRRSVLKIIDDFPKGGEVHRKLTRALSFIKDKKIKPPEGRIIIPGQPKEVVEKIEFPSLRRLHNAKLEIDQMINKVGADSLGNTTKAKLVETKNQLLNLMDEASPEYARAREVFRQNSPAVTQLEDSIIGKVANLDDTQLKTASKKIFDPTETNLQVVKRAKKVIDDVDPDAWNLLFRSEIERRIGSISGTLEAESLENIPGQLFRAIFGNNKSRAILKAGATGENAKNLNYLSKALARARRGRIGGSQTATREEIKKELRGGVFSAISNILSPFGSLKDFFQNYTFDGRVKIMTDALFDPLWAPQMKKLRQLSPNSPASGRAMIQLFKDASKQVEEDNQ